VELTVPFQSNHTGIETIARKDFIIDDFNFQSNHTGIETESPYFHLELFDIFQSNHTGIETSYIAFFKEKNVFLPIEPYWN